jgi:hypothetical protein
MAGVKKDVDWEGLETGYRSGKSFRLLAKEFGISSTRIAQVADENNWTRDLTAIIAEKTATKLNAANLNTNLNGKKASEREVVEATAQVQTNTILAHRTDIQRGRNLTMLMMAELEFQTNNMDLLEQLRELMHSPDDKGVDKRDELFRKVISLQSRAGTMKTLAESLKSLIGLERQAFNISGIDDDGNKESAADTGTATNYTALREKIRAKKEGK